MADDKSSGQGNQPDRIALLYPNVNEGETLLPRSWSPKDKFNLIGLSQNNLRVHYKGKTNILEPLYRVRTPIKGWMLHGCHF